MPVELIEFILQQRQDLPPVCRSELFLLVVGPIVTRMADLRVEFASELSRK